MTRDDSAEDMVMMMFKLYTYIFIFMYSRRSRRMGNVEICLYFFLEIH